MRAFCCLTALCVAWGLASASAGANEAVGIAWDWRLAGVIVGPGVSVALFARDRETQRVEAGRQIDGWTVTTIRTDGVTITSAAGERVLHPQAPETAVGPSLALPPTAVAPRDAARAQRHDEAAAEAILSDATRQMMRQGGARSR
ncbi:MAG TPA: hypothetical protein VGV37_25340 [Aliidongia sp.]|uniref:hypothetical protein n=1 Tax=Aliidongia sp. TaxID=1914230 RepID=UPI002DDD1B4A|nr:hypothetical protein [Aliidongia sp.]HEV2677881.1 hypothetical protein [Aliidongia sp.]